jgi:hypothetical protein
MRGLLDTAGERLRIESALSWVSELIEEGSGGELRGFEAPGASVQVRVEADRRPFDTNGWALLTRGAWQRNGEVVVENVCTAGFDLHLRCSPDQAEFTYRWRPPRRERAAARVLRSRFHLLARAVLIQYPALWWAGNRNRAPLHVSACAAGASTALVSAASGVGRSTLVLQELEAGGRTTGDNLAVGDGSTVWGLVEPARIKGAGGRSMPHGRREAPIPGRIEALTPDSIVVLDRGELDRASLSPCSAAMAARSLVTSTYMAGELRRYWAFAATLAAGSGVGPAHPPVTDAASAFSANLPCFLLVLGKRPGGRLADLLETVQAEACS